MSSGCRCPCTRTCGGELVVIWRSLPDMSSIFFSRSLSVTFMTSCLFSSSLTILVRSRFFLFCKLCKKLVDGLARHFFQGGDAIVDLNQASAAQGQHALLNGLLLQFHGRGPNQDQLAHIIVNFHDFVEPRPALVPGAVADSAALPLEDLGGPCLFRGKPGFHFGLGRQRN